MSTRQWLFGPFVQIEHRTSPHGNETVETIMANSRVNIAWIQINSDATVQFLFGVRLILWTCDYRPADHVDGAYGNSRVQSMHESGQL